MEAKTKKANALWHGAKMVTVYGEVKSRAECSISLCGLRSKSRMNIRRLGKRPGHLPDQRGTAIWLLGRSML